MQRKAELALIMATFFWGWTFPVIKDAIVVLPVFAFLMWRFGLSVVLLVPGTKLPNLKTITKGSLLGLLLFAGYAFQTLGLLYTSPENCAFITALNLIFIALARARTLRVWSAVAIAVAGFWFLTVPNKELNIGDFLSLIGALAYAIHILLLDKLDDSYNSKQLAIIQFAIIAIFSMIISFSVEDIQQPEQWDLSIILALAITILGATIFALWAQTHFQRFTTAIRTSLIFALEPVFAVIITFWFYDSDLTLSTGLGAALIFVAIMLVR